MQRSMLMLRPPLRATSWLITHSNLREVILSPGDGRWDAGGEVGKFFVYDVLQRRLR